MGILIFEAFKDIIEEIGEDKTGLLMKGGILMYLKAALKFRNILLLLAGVLLAAGTASADNLPNWLPMLFAAAGAVSYATVVIRTAKSSKFKDEIALSEKLDGISKLSWECSSLYRRISRNLGKTLRAKAVGVLKQKQELMDYFEKYSDDPIKQRIIEQALKLVMAYFNLASNYSDRMRELSNQNLSDLHNRINFNNRKIGSLKNYEAVLELTKTVEMDEKLLKNLQEEREHLEMVNVRLDQIESTIVGFKHRILSSDLSDPETEEIENVINEASALDNALNEHGRLRQRL